MFEEKVTDPSMMKLIKAVSAADKFGGRLSEWLDEPPILIDVVLEWSNAWQFIKKANGK